MISKPKDRAFNKMWTAWFFLFVFVYDEHTCVASLLCACSNTTSPETLRLSFFVVDSFLFNWLDLLAFSLSGLKADGTSCAAMAYVMADLHREGAKLGRVAFAH